MSFWNIIYHVFIGMALIITTIVAKRQLSTFPENEAKRLASGLYGLILLQVLFIISSFIYSNNPEIAHNLLPIVDRAINAYSLLIMIWLWAFPQKSKPVDLLLSLSPILILLFGFFSFNSWSVYIEQRSDPIFFNTTTIDSYWTLFYLFFSILGLALLYFRKPSKWKIGAFSFLLLAIGTVIHLIIPAQSDFPNAIRLLQIPALFFLIPVARRYFIKSAPKISLEPSKKSRSSTAAKDSKSDSPQQRLTRDFLTLAASRDNQTVGVLLTQVISQTMPADLCILLSPPETAKQFVLLCGYDLISEENIAGNSIDAEDLPRLASAANRKKSLRLSADSKSPDLKSLKQLLLIEKIGGVLAAPIVSSNSTLLAYIILASPYANKNWSMQDEDYINQLTPMIAEILDRGTGNFIPEEESLGSMPIIYPGEEDEEEQGTETSAETQNEVSNLNTKIKELQKQITEKESTIEGMETLLLGTENTDLPSDDTASAALEEEIAALKIQLELAEQAPIDQPKDTTESDQLKLHLAQIQARVQELKSTAANNDQLQKQLNHTKSKVQKLESSLVAAKQAAKSAKPAPIQPAAAQPATDQALSLEQAELIASIAQDVKQPLSSVSGYTDLLLGESVGILGALQRKFLDRVKTATDRMNGLINNLIQITALDSGNIELTTESVLLSSVIDDAIGQTSNQMREKNIILRVDLPEELPSLNTDRDSLQQILLHLIQNAGASSPDHGEISLSAYVEDNEKTGEQSVLIQVTDTGGGISEDDLPKVFSRLYRADNPLIDGVGETGVGLSIAKALSEALGGRIWVESELEVGSTFSVSLPITNLETAENTGNA